MSLPASRRRTATSAFGVGRREAHDASAFYRRFEPPQLDDDDTVVAPGPVAEPFVCGDARRMDAVDDGAVALVVTSPPYFAGKRYEEELGRDGVPGSYLEYLRLLEDVFAECLRKLEPGGRLAVNVANLGRKPYRSLSADVIGILQDKLRMLLRGEVVWRKGDGASGSCAWGSFRSPANPVLRDLTERVVIASKGRFDRARSARRRQAAGLPHEVTLSADEFMAATLDVWDIPPERAQRVGHPAPFPVELPERLIHLYTYRHDLVLDPFMGSGSTLVASARAGRRYAGYDTDPAYVAIARSRVAAELDGGRLALDETAKRVEAPARSGPAEAEAELAAAGFLPAGTAARRALPGLTVDLVVIDAAGAPWFVEVCAAFTTTRGGLARAEAVWRALGRCQLLARHGRWPALLLTSHLPRPGSEGDLVLRAAGPAAVFDVVELGSPAGRERLRRYAGGHQRAPLPGFWTPGELARATPPG